MNQPRETVSFDRIREHLVATAREASGDPSIDVILGRRGAGTRFEEETNSILVDPAELEKRGSADKITKHVRRIAADSCRMGFARHPGAASDATLPPLEEGRLAPESPGDAARESIQAFECEYAEADLDTLRRDFEPLVNRYAESAKAYMAKIGPIIGDLDVRPASIREQRMLSSLAARFYWHMSEVTEGAEKDSYTARSIEMQKLAGAYEKLI